MSEPKPISLSDDQLTSLMNAAAPLPSPYDRSAFLVAVAAYFAGRSEIGDGELHRVVAELQRVYFHRAVAARGEPSSTAPVREKRVFASVIGGK